MEMQSKSKWNEFTRHFLGEDFFEDIAKVSAGKEPNADVYVGSSEVIVVIDLPGLEDPQSLDIQINDDELWIKGHFPTPYQGYKVVQTERRRGKFEKNISLGTAVSPKYTHARYKRGVLELRFPKLQGKRVQKLNIQTID